MSTRNSFGILRRLYKSVEKRNHITLDSDREWNAEKNVDNLVELLKSSPKAAAVRKFSKSYGLSEDEVENMCFSMLGTIFGGGLSVGFTPEDVAKKHGVDEDTVYKQMELGQKVEMEHVDKTSPFAVLFARKIALDHLTESPCYYDHLAKMEEATVK